MAPEIPLPAVEGDGHSARTASRVHSLKLMRATPARLRYRELLLKYRGAQKTFLLTLLRQACCFIDLYALLS